MRFYLPRVFAIAVTFAGSGCSRPVPAALDAATLGGDSVAPAAQATEDAARSSPEDAAREVVAAWSDALDRHDLAALDRLYAPRVKFYGKDLPKSAVVDLKKSALGPASTFHQSIVGPIDIALDSGSFIATFQKRSGTSHLRDVKARIVVADHRVREESDAPSDARAAEARNTGCESVAAAVVSGLAAVKKVMEEDRKELEGKTDGRAMGGIGPLQDDEGGFSASLGVHHPERYEAQVWYAVDRAGKLTVSVLGEDVAVSGASKAAVERACKAP